MRNIFCIVLALAAFSASNHAFASQKLSGSPIAVTPSGAQNAFDSNGSSVYRSSQASYAWVGLDLGDRYVIDRVGWQVVNPSKALLGVFQGATKPDFSDAVPIYLIDQTPQAGAMQYADVDCSRGFRYLRYVGPSGSYCEIAELEFYGQKGDGDDSHLWQVTNLPTVVVNTVNGEIPYDKEHDISSTVIIISENGSKLLEKSETSIRERGNASRDFPKKPWRIKFDKKQNVLDAPAKAKKWTLINNYGDKSLMRNKLAFDIAQKMGMEYVPFCAFVDVILNGEYKGCYQLCDQIEVADGRVDIEEMDPEDIAGEALTGGYFIEIDAYATSEASWFRSAHYGIPVTIKSPDEDEIVPQQTKYITDYFNMLENMMKDTDPLTGYRSVFDNESFIQHMLVNELAGNTDCYWSTYMYKRRGNPVIFTGPVWDFDLGFNNDARTYPVHTRSGNGYLWNSGYASSADGMRYFAQRILLKDESTAQEILSVWSKARRNGLTEDWLKDKVNEYAAELDQSQRLNFLRWPILDQIVHQNPMAFTTYTAACNAVKAFISPQMKHLDSVIGFDPSTLEEEEEDSVDDILSDDNDAPVQYFTTTGIPVDNPTTPGIYIRRQGRLTQKIIIR